MLSETLRNLSKEQLLELLELDGKNWTAIDGVWFQSVEEKFGMEEAIYHDEEAWKRFTVLEAKRLRDFLQLPEQCGLEGLAKALPYRIKVRNDEDAMEWKDGKLIYKVVTCRVQAARTRKGMPLHPCKSVAEYEYGWFAAALDPRIRCRCVSCYPMITDTSCACCWEFSMDAE